jgi:hypothetical protein
MKATLHNGYLAASMVLTLGCGMPPEDDATSGEAAIVATGATRATAKDDRIVVHVRPGKPERRR